MSALGMILKGLGVNVSEEHVRQIEALLPQLPSRMQQTVEVINGAVADTHAKLDSIDGRLKTVEVALTELLKGTYARGNEQRPGGKRGSHAAANGAGR